MKKKDHLSYSALSAFKKSPNHLLAYWNKTFKPTDAMKFGSLIHKLLLQPETFSYEFAIFEGKTRRGKEWEAFSALNEGKTIIKAQEVEDANKIIQNAMKNKVFSEMIQNATAVEKELNWNHKGVKFKGYADMISKYNNKKCVIDIKTTTDAGKRFERDLMYNDYKMQLAMYTESFEDTEMDAYVVAIETKLPFNVQVYKLNETLLHKGCMDYEHYTTKYNEWDGKAEGYTEDIVEVYAKIEEITPV